MNHDLLFLAHNRREFTAASIAALTANTDWSHVDRLIKFVDVDEQGRDDGTQNLVVEWRPPGPVEYTRIGQHGGPVNVMLKYLEEFGCDAEWFAKIDNDVIVPPGWWEAGAQVMKEYPGLDLLGIEPPASRTPAPWAGHRRVAAPEYDGSAMTEEAYRFGVPAYARCDAIGGIGFMRTSPFLGRQRMLQHSVYGGFTDWQQRHPAVIKGWIVPPLKLFLLDRLPLELWASLSAEYIQRGWQRPWTNYTPADVDALSGEPSEALWSWWLEARI
jgi:hypothetical protein